MCLWRCRLLQNPKSPHGLESNWETKLLAGTAQPHPRPTIRSLPPGLKSHAQLATWTSRARTRAEGPRARAPPPGCLPLPSPLPPDPPSSAPPESPPPLRLPSSNPGGLHPPASPLAASFFISPNLASRHLHQAPVRPLHARPFPSQTLVSTSPSQIQTPVLTPIPHLPIFAQTVASPPPLRFPPAPTPPPQPQARGVDVSRSPRSMPREGLPRWAQEKRRSSAPRGRAAAGGLCGSGRCL